jgi:hypothetical protein
MKPLFQNDPQWKDTKIGLQEQLTIEQVGCLLTSLTMTVNYYGGSETPATLNEKMKAVQGFSGAWIKSAMVPSAFPELGFQRQMHEDSTPISLDLVDAGLARDSLVLVRVDWTPDANIDSHWVVVHGKQGDDYQIWDPWQKAGAADTLVGRYGFGGKQAADIILEAIWYGKKDFDKTAVVKTLSQPAAKPAKKTRSAKKATAAKKTAVAVQPTVTQLTLRSQPVVNQTNVVKTVSQNDVLTVLEDAGEAVGKIGQQGQWLHVADATGAEGYVAAWYVKQTKASAAKPAGGSAAGSQPRSNLTVRSTTSSLSLRQKPIVTNETLIRYVRQDETLQVIDDANPLAKIGVKGQWLHVRTDGGTEGYVAAWFVERV